MAMAFSGSPSRDFRSATSHKSQAKTEDIVITVTDHLVTLLSKRSSAWQLLIYRLPAGRFVMRGAMHLRRGGSPSSQQVLCPWSQSRMKRATAKKEDVMLGIVVLGNASMLD